MSQSGKSGTFIVVFIGQSKGESPIDEVRERIEAHFQLSTQQVDLLFSGEPVVFERGLSRDEAVARKQEIEALGGIAWVDDLELADDVFVYQDRRKGRDDRRHGVNGSDDSLPDDRRHSRGRRFDDEI